VLPPGNPNEDHNGDDDQECANKEATEAKPGEQVRPRRVGVSAHRRMITGGEEKIDVPESTEISAEGR
jgi:hypothetical protein